MTKQQHDAIPTVVDTVSKMAHFIPTEATVTAEEVMFFLRRQTGAISWPTERFGLRPRPKICFGVVGAVLQKPSKSSVHYSVFGTR